MKRTIILFSLCFILTLSHAFAIDSYTQLQGGYRRPVFLSKPKMIALGSKLVYASTLAIPTDLLIQPRIFPVLIYNMPNSIWVAMPLVKRFSTTSKAASANNTRQFGLGKISESTNQGFILEDYYVRLQYAAMDIKFGQYKVPFGRQWMIYSGNLDFVNRSSPMQAFLLGRDRGVTLNRYKDTWSLSMGVFNGAGQMQVSNPWMLQTVLKPVQ